MEILTLINSGSEQLKKNKINSHSLEAELLLAKILRKKREELIINLKNLLIEDQKKSLLPIYWKKKNFGAKTFL